MHRIAPGLPTVFRRNRSNVRTPHQFQPKIPPKNQVASLFTQASPGLIFPEQQRLILPENPNWLSPGSLAGLSKAYSTDGSNPNEQPIVYRIAIIDSGSGGFIFKLKAYPHLEHFLLRLQTIYNVRFELVHVGDASNAPYGEKTYDQILDLTKNLTYYAARELEARKIIVACNTACSTIHEPFREWAKQEIPNLDIMAIITHTARELYANAAKSAQRNNSSDTYVGVLATPATIKSQEYVKALATAHAEEYSHEKSPLTVVIHNDERLKMETPMPLVYEGSQALDPEEGQDVLNQIRSKDLRKELSIPIQYVVMHAPPSWVSILEGKAPGDLNKEVRTETDRFLGQFKDNTAELDLDPEKLGVVGSCCTHYPYMTDVILEVMRSDKWKVNAPIIEQAPILSKIAIKSIQGDFDKQDEGIRKRRSKIQIHELPKPLIRMESYTTVNPTVETDLKSFEMVQRIGFKIAPTLASLVNFSKIDQIPNWTQLKEKHEKKAAGAAANAPKLPNAA